jgi:uncharacterized membrane protein
MPKDNVLIKPDTSSDDKTDECSELEQMASLFFEKFHSGPLPDPDTLKEYNEILPDAAERIFKMAEKEQEHHHTMGVKLVDSEIRKVSKGQNYALIISLVGLVGAIICALLDQVTIGSIIGVSTVASLASNFLYGKQKKSKEDEIKRPGSGKRLKRAKKNDGEQTSPSDPSTEVPNSSP